MKRKCTCLLRITFGGQTHRKQYNGQYTVGVAMHTVTLGKNARKKSSESKRSVLWRISCLQQKLRFFPSFSCCWFLSIAIDILPAVWMRFFWIGALYDCLATLERWWLTGRCSNKKALGKTFRPIFFAKVIWPPHFSRRRYHKNPPQSSLRSLCSGWKSPSGML